VIEKKIKKYSKIFARKQKDSKRREKFRVKLARLYEYKNNFLNHFHWNLVHKLTSENKAISIENLNISGMIKNKRLSHSIHYSNFGGFIDKLEQKANDYDTIIYKVGRFYPSSKLCSKCGNKKDDLKLSDRIYFCDCGLEIDRDLNASINICNEYFKNNSVEYIEYNHGETINPCKIIYNFSGSFSEVITESFNIC